MNNGQEKDKGETLKEAPLSVFGSGRGKEAEFAAQAGMLLCF